MTAPIEIRPAAAVDAAALGDLQRRASLVWEEQREFLLDRPDLFVVPPAQIADGRIIVAETEGRLAGFAVILPRVDGESDLDGLFVEPDLWRLGIGTTLMRAAEAVAQSSGACRIHVVANPHALEFYRACGFILTGEVDVEFGTAFAMQKPLPLSNAT